MDEDALYISDELANRLAVIAGSDEDILSDEALDRIIDDDSIDLGRFLEFVSQLCPMERKIAQEFIFALERRLYARIIESAKRIESTKEGRAPRVSGSVKWFNQEGGFGFIVSHDKIYDVFVGSSVIQRSGFRTLETGQLVEFDVEKTADGNLAAYRLLLEKL